MTTYDNRLTPYGTIAEVVSAGQNCWYCWGAFHTTGQPSGDIVDSQGNRALAECLVKPNASSTTDPAARGTIFTYGVDGVCHQLANQILYATGSPSHAPATVRQARGYMLSTFLYGTYGLTTGAWRTKVQSCLGLAEPVSGLPEWRTKAMPDTPRAPAATDDFLDRAQELLGGGSPQLQSLMALRGEIQNFIVPRVPGFTAPPAPMLNERNNHLIEQALLLLGPEKFRELFGVEPGEWVDLVDPNMAESQRGDLPKSDR